MQIPFAPTNKLLEIFDSGWLIGFSLESKAILLSRIKYADT